MVKISPSILSANFANLGQELIDLTSAKADMIHIDVMDGHFVPNITIGPKTIKDIRKFSNLPFDTHLMISEPYRFIKEFADAGSDIITIHYESCVHVDKSLSLIKSLGKKAGISLVPSTSHEVLIYLLDKIDLILVMTVNPGFGGQELIASQIDKIKKIRSIIDQNNLKIELSVDGGVNPSNANDLIKAGADILIAGSYIFQQGSDYYQQRISSLKND